MSNDQFSEHSALGTEHPLKNERLPETRCSLEKDWDMAHKNDEVTDWLKKAAALGFTLLSKKDTISGIVDFVYDKDKKGFRFKGIRNSVQLLGRMLTAFFKGEYKNLSPMFFVSTIAGIIYFITDKDIIPDKIPIIGVADDIGMLMWVFSIYTKELDKFDFWEIQQNINNIQIA